MATFFTCASLENKLSDAFSPSHIQVINESHLHSGHAGREGKEDDDITHVRIVMNAACFNNMQRVAIHRAIYSELGSELHSGLHAIALDVKGNSQD